MKRRWRSGVNRSVVENCVRYSPAVVPQSGLTVEAWATYDESTLGTGWRYPTIARQNRNAGQESFFLRVEANNTNQTRIRFLINASRVEPFTER